MQLRNDFINGLDGGILHSGNGMAAAMSANSTPVQPGCSERIFAGMK
jgi:hypothetical protein